MLSGTRREFLNQERIQRYFEMAGGMSKGETVEGRDSLVNYELCCCGEKGIKDALLGVFFA